MSDANADAQRISITPLTMRYPTPSQGIHRYFRR